MTIAIQLPAPGSDHRDQSLPGRRQEAPSELAAMHLELRQSLAPVALGEHEVHVPEEGRAQLGHGVVVVCIAHHADARRATR